MDDRFAHSAYATSPTGEHFGDLGKNMGQECFTESSPQVVKQGTFFSSVDPNGFFPFRACHCTTENKARELPRLGRTRKSAHLIAGSLLEFGGRFYNIHFSFTGNRAFCGYQNKLQRHGLSFLNSKIGCHLLLTTLVGCSLFVFLFVYVYSLSFSLLQFVFACSFVYSVKKQVFFEKNSYFFTAVLCCVASMHIQISVRYAVALFKSSAPTTCFFHCLFCTFKNPFFSAGRLGRQAYNTTKKHLVKCTVGLFVVCFPLKQKEVFFEEKNVVYQAQNPNHDVDCVIADVGHASDLLATIVVTSTVHTAVISQKRENKRLKRK